MTEQAPPPDQHPMSEKKKDTKALSEGMKKWHAARKQERLELEQLRRERLVWEATRAAATAPAPAAPAPRAAVATRKRVQPVPAPGDDEDAEDDESAGEEEDPRFQRQAKRVNTTLRHLQQVDARLARLGQSAPANPFMQLVTPRRR